MNLHSIVQQLTYSRNAVGARPLFQFHKPTRCVWSFDMSIWTTRKVILPTPRNYTVCFILWHVYVGVGRRAISQCQCFLLWHFEIQAIVSMTQNYTPCLSIQHRKVKVQWNYTLCFAISDFAIQEEEDASSKALKLHDILYHLICRGAREGRRVYQFHIYMAYLFIWPRDAGGKP